MITVPMVHYWHACGKTKGMSTFCLPFTMVSCPVVRQLCHEKMLTNPDPKSVPTTAS